MRQMTDTEFKKLSDLDKVKYSLTESLKEHKNYLHKPYWKGSNDMAENILKTIQTINRNNNKYRIK